MYNHVADNRLKVRIGKLSHSVGHSTPIKLLHISSCCKLSCMLKECNEIILNCLPTT